MTFWTITGAVFVGYVLASLFLEFLTFLVTYYLTKKQMKIYVAEQEKLAEAYPNGIPADLLQFAKHFPPGSYLNKRPEVSEAQKHGQYL